MKQNNNEYQISFQNRVRLIEALNNNVARLDKNRVKECKEAILSAYNTATIIPKVGQIINESGPPSVKFQSIGIRHLINMGDFNAQNFYWGPYFADVGRAIASGERKYLQEIIRKSIKPDNATIDSSAPDFTILKRRILSLLESDSPPDTVLAPIELFVQFVADSNLAIDWDSGRPEQIVMNGKRINLFWSHRYAPLDSFIVFNSKGSTWRVIKDRNGNTVTIAIGESNSPDSVEYWVEELAKCEIVKSEAFCVIEVNGLHPISNENE